MPLLTIITINYNNRSGLEKTIGSVGAQEYRVFEYIVIDGGSTDGSKELIEAKSQELDYWVSERDKGIYHAMNKGIKRASGEYLLFLNSGDMLNGPDGLSRLLSGDPKEDIIYGDLVMQTEDGAWLKRHPDEITFDYFLRDTLPHPSSAIRKDLFDRVGFYNESFKIVSDWEFFMNAICRFNASYKHVPFPISVFYQDGISSNPKNDELINKEKEKTLVGQYAAFLPDYRLMDKYKSDLINIKNSRLHNFIFRLQNSWVHRLLKRQ